MRNAGGNPVFGVEFLRFLALPGHKQREFVREGVRTFGCELREGYFELTEGLVLFMGVGQDSLYWPRERASLESAARESVFHLYSVLWLLNEHGTVALQSLPEDDGAGPVAGLWELIRKLSCEILQKAGLEAGPPSLPFEQLIEAVCVEVKL
jgi:hypothetical protein